MNKLVAGLVVMAAAGGVALAKPSAEELAHAKKLYTAAEAEVRINKFAEAAKDYTAAYELTKDPALLFKIASAHQNAGACDSAVPYYRQYLQEAAPAPKFVELTKERLAKCGASADAVAPVPPTPAEPVTPVAPVQPTPPDPVATRPSPPKEPPAPPVTPPVTSPITPPAAPPVVAVHTPTPAPDDDQPGHGRDRAWAAIGAATFLGSVGVVLFADGRSSDSSGEKSAAYATWGLGGVAAIGAAYLFLRHTHTTEPTALVVPTVDPHGAGVSARFRF